ncbi:XisI protein [Cuspidothrix issatschenkoi LEGE 03284]|uniref:XisI protein n=1 Tax=Cuspidothrix issatschenkoi TaxID=230752 RepID=UPI0018814A01|nr:XisI protein [Cuspidothrix issatschenkoi]MBE9233151.1 XisI protein [Cuspidothrix issatschenkoi LEGE 03284]
MDKINKYREYIKTLLTNYAKDDISTNEVDVQLIFDTENDHYQWMNVGWEHLTRVYMTVIHLDIKNGKIRLQQNLTEENPAGDLVKMGVPREDIVLGLHPPYKRPYTDYGVA